MLFSQSLNTGRVAKLVDAVAWRRLRVLSLEMIAKFLFRECFSHPLESCHFGDGFLFFVNQELADQLVSYVSSGFRENNFLCYIEITH